MTIYDSSGQCIDANKIICEIIGANKDQVLSQNYYHIESWKKSGLLEKATEALTTNKITQKELTVTSTFGKELTAKASFLPYTDEGENYLLVTLDDLTQIKDTEDALHESNRRFHELFTHMSSGVAIYDVKGNGDDFFFKDLNKSGERISNVKREDLLGKSVLEVFPGVKEMGLFGVFQRVWKTGMPAIHPVTQYQDNRLSHWSENHVFKLSSGEIVAVYDDITKRKQAEEDLHLQSIILTGMSEGLYLIRRDDGIIVFTNPVFEKMFGYEPGEMIGKHVSIVNYPTGKSPEETARKILGIIEKKGIWQGEIQNIKKDGTPFWSFASVSTLDHFRYGKVLVSVHSDITERKRAEEELQSFAQRLAIHVDQTPLGVIEWDLSFKVTQWN